MKLLTGIVLSALMLPAVAGTIRHDTDDSLYQMIGGLEPFAPVGKIIGQSGDGFYGCSGTAISSHWMLTAAHCVDQAQAINFYLPKDGGGFTAYQGTSWEANQNFNEANLLGGWDVGLVHFDQTLNVTPATLYRGNDDVSVVEAISGYGLTGNGLTGTMGQFGTKRVGLNVITFRYSNEGDGNQILFGDFDPPADNNPSGAEDLFGDGFAIPYEYSSSFGDSGGGVFIFENNHYYLAGVNSFGFDGNNDGIFADYGDGFGATRVSSLAHWIDSETGFATVPETSALIMMLIGLLGIFGVRLKRR